MQYCPLIFSLSDLKWLPLIYLTVAMVMLLLIVKQDSPSLLSHHRSALRALDRVRLSAYLPGSAHRGMQEGGAREGAQGGFREDPEDWAA